MHPRRTHIERWLEPPRAVAAALLTAALAVPWALVVATGSSVWAQALALPVVLAAAWWGPWQAVLTAVVAAGATMPLAVSTEPAPAVTQVLLLAGVGVATALIAGQLRVALSETEADRDVEHLLAVEKSAMVQTVSHEFRTPLTVLRGVAQTLSRPGLQPRDATALMAALERAIDRLDEMILMLLAVAEADAERPLSAGTTDVASVVHEVVETLRRYGAEQRVRIHARGSCDADLPPDEVRIVVFALLENALKFSDAPVDVDVIDDRDTVQLTIRDRGIGIDPAFLARRAFESLTQQDASTTRLHGGLGIGLFTADRVVRSLGGQLRIVNRRKGGVEATVTLPRWYASRDLSVVAGTSSTA